MASEKNILPLSDEPERIVIPQSLEFAIVKSSALDSPSVVVHKSNLPLESTRALSKFPVFNVIVSAEGNLNDVSVSPV